MLRFGFAGEASPRCIVPSEVKNTETGEVRSVLNYKNEEDLYSLLVDFLHMLYFKYVLYKCSCASFRTKDLF